MDVVDWLRDLGLEQYAAAFRENAVTADLLPDLSPQDLKDIGVTAVGHRRRLAAGDRWRCAAMVIPDAGVSPETCCRGNSHNGIGCGTPPAQRDVLRSGRIDRALFAAGSRGPGSGDPRLSGPRPADDGTVRRLYSALHGRRRVDLFRLAGSPRGGGGAGRAGRSGRRLGGRRHPGRGRDAPGSHRRRHRPRRGRRAYRDRRLHASRRSSAKRQIARRGCRGLPGRTAW